MYANKPKGLPIQSDAQAKDKLAHYVYEYLTHLGAKNSAQAFLNECNWDRKGAVLSEAPGFLLSWWCVFWDLYCAAPERRENFETSQEAKIFHDYSPNPQGPNNQVMMGQPPYQRFHSGGRGMRAQSSVDFSPAPNSNNMQGGNNPMNMDQSRVPTGMSPMSRLTPPGNRVPPNGGMNTMSFNGPPSVGSLRGPNSNNPPSGLPNQMQNAPMSPMPINMQQQQQLQQQQMQQQQQQQQQPPPQQPQQQQQQQQPQHNQQARWSNPSGPQNQNQQPPPPPPPPQGVSLGYTSSSPVPYVGMTHHGGPSTPGIIGSPQDGDMNFNIIKNGMQGGLQFHDQNMGHMVQMNPDMQHHSHLNGEILDAMKSPISNIPGQRHNEEHSNTAMPDLNHYTHFSDNNIY